MVEPYRVWGESGRLRGRNFREKSGEFLDFQGALSSQTRLAKCPRPHFNVKSPPLGLTVSVLMRGSWSKVSREGVSGATLDLSGTNQFVHCGSWFSFLVPGGS